MVWGGGDWEGGGLPEEDIGFWDGGVGGEEGDYGVGVGGGDGGEEGPRVEEAGVEKIRGFFLGVGGKEG